MTSPTHQPTPPHQSPGPVDAFCGLAADRLLAAGETLLKSLSEGRALDAKIIRAAMTAAFGVSDETGVWGWKDAYEAVEVAQVLFLQRYLPAIRARATSPADVLAMLAKVAGLTPTHTKRSEECVGLQQFSTPLELAYVASEAAALLPGDVVLEPSAGTGCLAVQAMTRCTALHLNEWAETRANLLSLLFPGSPLTRHNAEQIDDRLAAAVAPTVVIMNPPFSASPNSTTTSTGIDLRHVTSALARLQPGGRLVAITSLGLAPSNPTYRKAFARLGETATLVFTAALDGALFKRHGTAIETRLLVFDKVPAPIDHHPARAVCASAAELLQLLPSHVPLRVQMLPTMSAPKTATSCARAKTPHRAASFPQDHPHSQAGALPYDAVALAYELIADAKPRSSTSDALYEPYTPERIRIAAAQPHPTKIVQSAAMASVLPPPPTYVPHLPDRVVTEGHLSDAQLESVIYAGDAHAKQLAGWWRVDETFDGLQAAAELSPDAVQYRRGWFLGDGTGVGKGRQIAAIILDNWLKGRRRALWISKSETLPEDAQRDWSALGQEKLLIVPQSRYRQGTPIKLGSGILFTTYATLRSEERDGKASRLLQLINWLGRDFDGVIVFDESHAMGNAAGSCSERGAQRASLQGLAGLRLQHALPNARIVYVSATGATTVENLAYAQRLGLWGSDDLPFESRSAFVSAMHMGGIASSEVLARDLKSLGLYTARSLSYEGVAVDILEHVLTPEQIRIYDEFAGAYQTIHANLAAALTAARITGDDGETLNKSAKSSAMSAFEGNKLRFFGHLITAMKMPTLIRAIADDLAQGHAAVVQLVSTSEALMDRRLADISPAEYNDLSFDITPREYVLDYLKHSFPVQLFEDYTDEEGKPRSRQARDTEGNALVCRDAEKRRDALIERLGALPPVQAAMDQLIHHFGTDVVAEVTGRSRRVVRRQTARGAVLAVESRPSGSNLCETQAFMDDTKRVLIFSDAGGTGRSYHADLTMLNQRLRVHYLLEAGWKADGAIQGLGRTNRANQRQPPLFRPVTTDVRGEKRFISTIARRLDSLGAITRGQRQTGGQGLFRSSDNLESSYARDALRQFYQLIHAGKIACCSLERFETITGLHLTDRGGTLLDELPPISRFLNRVLALPIALQNELFAQFEQIIEGRVEAAIAKGTFEVGVETIRAESLRISNRTVIATNAGSGATTELLEVKTREKNTPLTLAAVLERGQWYRPFFMLINAKSNRVAMQVPTSSITLEDGTVQQRVRLMRPMESYAIPLAEFLDSQWQTCDAPTFAAAWNREVADVPPTREGRLDIVIGLLLPIWKRLPYDNPRVYRFVTDDGQSVLGRLVPATSMDAFDTPQGNITPDNAWESVTHGRPIRLADGLEVRRALVMGRHRIELAGFDADALPRLKAMGLFSEIISYRTRLFVPMGKDGPPILVALMAKHPVLA